VGVTTKIKKKVLQLGMKKKNSCSAAPSFGEYRCTQHNKRQSKADVRLEDLKKSEERCNQYKAGEETGAG
jgi:hypothetical protein